MNEALNRYLQGLPARNWPEEHAYREWAKVDPAELATREREAQAAREVARREYAEAAEARFAARFAARQARRDEWTGNLSPEDRARNDRESEAWARRRAFLPARDDYERDCYREWAQQEADAVEDQMELMAEEGPTKRGESEEQAAAREAETMARIAAARERNIEAGTYDPEMPF